MNPLLSCGAALLMAVSAAAQSADPFQPVVHVEYGRAVLVQRGSRGELLLPETETGVSGIAYLLVGAGARASITWRGQASLIMHGPAEIEWSPSDEESGTGDLVWSVLRLGEIDMEVRRGTPTLKLPGGWRTRLGEGAFYVSGNGRDACDLELRAGQPLALRPELRGGRVRPPVSLATGMRVRLSNRHIAVSRPDATADAGNWDRVSWPWRGGRPTLPGTQETQTTDDAELVAGRESVAIEPAPPIVTLVVPEPRRNLKPVELDSHPIVPVHVEPEPSWVREPAPAAEPTEPQIEEPILTVERIEIEPIETPPVVAPVETIPEPIVTPEPEPIQEPVVVEVQPEPIREPIPEPVKEPTVAVDPAPRPVQEPIATPEPPRPKPTPKPVQTKPTKAPATFVASQWHGIPFSELEPVGDGAIERSDAVRTTRIGSNRWRIALSARADHEIWFFGKDEDVELQPGASVTIGIDGFVQSVQGLTRTVDAPLDRPPLGELK